jgi:shikimate kinase
MKTISNSVFIGFKAVGKTTVAKRYAQIHKKKFIDLDDEIVKLDSDAGSCRELYRRKGEDHFRRLENLALDSLRNKNNIVVAAGGGAIEKSKNRQILKKIGRIIYLKDDEDVLFQRIKEIGFPPFIDQDNPKGSFRRLLKKREKLYDQIADISIDCHNKSYEQIISEIP